MTQFWLLDLTQLFSGDKDVVGAYERGGVWSGADAKKQGGRNYAAPWAGMSGSRILNV